MTVVKRLSQPRVTVRRTTVNKSSVLSTRQLRATVRRTIVDKPSVLSTRQPSRLEEMGDANFGTLDATKDGSIVTFDLTTNKFILTTPDQVLATSAEDKDISDTFVTQLETELDLDDIAIGVIDGGAF